MPVTRSSDVGGSATAEGVRSRSFRSLLVAWTVTSVGDGVRVAALPLYTAVSTRDPLAVSLVAVAEALPWLLVALPAGALVDRWRAKQTVIGAHGFRCGVTALLSLLIWSGSAGIPALVLCGFLLGSAETFADSAAQTMLVSVAGVRDLERANGHMVRVETVGVEIAGPLAAAALFAWSPAACFAVNATTFAIAIVCVVAVPLADTPSVRDPAGSLRSEVLSGIRFLVRNPTLRTVVGVVGLTALLTSAVNTVAILYAVDVLKVPAAAVPTLLVCTAIGTIAASHTASRLAARYGGGWVMVGALIVLSSGIAVLGAVRIPAAAWIAYLVMGFGVGTWNVLSAANRQRLTPPPMMGRVTSAHRVLAWGLMPLGAGLAGPLAELTSLGGVIIGASVLTGVVVVLAAPRLRLL